MSFSNDREKAEWTFNHKITTCPECGSNSKVENMKGNIITLVQCGWCNTQHTVTISTAKK